MEKAKQTTKWLSELLANLAKLFGDCIDELDIEYIGSSVFVNVTYYFNPKEAKP